MKKIILIIFMAIIFSIQPVKTIAMNSDYYQILEREDYDSEYNSCGIERDNFCANFSNVIVIIGYLVIILKIALPLIIIVKTTINLLPLITTGKPEAFKKAATSILISFAAAVFIFFLPTIIKIFLSNVNGYNDDWQKEATCKDCVLSASSDDCQKYVKMVRDCKN